MTPDTAGAPGGGTASVLPQGGSFMWAIRDRQRDRAYLFNGPQLGFSIPELFVEFELHSPAQPNLRGVSAAGVPLVGIGHNGHVAWGFTSGLSDEDDLYVEELTGPETYRFEGAERQMDCRDEIFDFNTAADRPPRPDRGSRGAVRLGHRADLPDRPRAGAVHRRRRRARPPLRDLGPRARDDRRAHRAQRRDRIERRRRGDATT